MWKKISIALCVLVVVLCSLYGYKIYELHQNQEVNKVYDFLLTHIVVTDNERLPIDELNKVVKSGVNSIEAKEIKNYFVNIINDKFDANFNIEQVYMYVDNKIRFNFKYENISFWYDYSNEIVNKFAFFRRYGKFYSLIFYNNNIEKNQRFDIENNKD